MKIEGPGKLLRIYIGVQDKYQGQPLYEAIVETARELGLAGTTVIRGVEGFGASSREIHKARILRLSERLPLLIEIVDSEERIRKAIVQFEQMLEETGKGVLMTLETVDILRYQVGKGKRDK